MRRVQPVNDAARRLADAALRGIHLEVVGGVPVSLTFAHLEHTAASWGHSASRVTIDDLKAGARKIDEIRRQREDLDRKVFVFHGPPEEFLALLADSGFRSAQPGVGAAMRDSFYGLEVQGRAGNTLTVAGTRAALRRFDAGEVAIPWMPAPGLAKPPGFGPGEGKVEIVVIPRPEGAGTNKTP